MSLFPFFKSTPQLSRFPVSVETFDVILQFDDLQSLVLPLGGLLNLLQNLRVRLRGLPHDLQRRAAMGAGDEAHAFIRHAEWHTTALAEHGDDFLGGDSENGPRGVNSALEYFFSRCRENSSSHSLHALASPARSTAPE